MRHGTTNRRQRSRGNGGNGQRRGNQNRAQVYDSNGPDVRIRGTAHQVCEKYLALSKDAMAGGDRILAESYMQHAEHYQRLINQFEDDVAQERAQEYGDALDGGVDNGRRSEARGNNKGRPASRESTKDDLSLPASILGGNVSSKSEGGTDRRTPVKMGADLVETVENAD